MGYRWDAENIKKANARELKETAAAIRSFLVDAVSKNGGHLSSNLGVVELTMALFRSFDLPKDKVIFDVGHQSYVYKMISGRTQRFAELRKEGGLSGFPKRSESEYDCFDTGHSSTSISAAIGMAVARDLRHEHYQVVSVIGDGSLTGGEAYEALNNVSQLKTNLIIILNDNEMSITRNVGGLRKYLTSIRSAAGYNKMKSGVKQKLDNSPVGEAVIRAVENTKDSIKELMVPTGMFFENLGIKYLGPVDGHDVMEMEKIFRRAKSMNRPVIIHVLTKKGKGYLPAEKHPTRFHGTGPFDPKTGKDLKESRGKSYSEVFGEFMTESAGAHPEIAAVTAAMATGVGLTQYRKAFPERFFDVGIAEQHAVTFAAGLASNAIHPYVAIYSSFLQRAYDQIVEDVCLQDLPVTFVIDRAGLVGSDGETHQGVYDISGLSSIPNLAIIAPRCGAELRKALDFSLTYDHPLAIRFPKASDDGDDFVSDIVFGKSETVEHGTRAAILCAGDTVSDAVEATKLLKDHGIVPTVVNARFLKPLDESMIEETARNHELVVTVENGAVTGGFGSEVASVLGRTDVHCRILTLGVPDVFMPQGTITEQKQRAGIDARSIAEAVMKGLKE